MEEKRERIKKIDKQIADLLLERAEVGKAIAKEKKERGLDKTDSEQEVKVLDRAKEWLSSMERHEIHTPRIFRRIIEFTKDQMKL